MLKKIISFLWDHKNILITGTAVWALGLASKYVISDSVWMIYNYGGPFFLMAGVYIFNVFIGGPFHKSKYLSIVFVALLWVIHEITEIDAIWWCDGVYDNYDILAYFLWSALWFLLIHKNKYLDPKKYPVSWDMTLLISVWLILLTGLIFLKLFIVFMGV